MSIRQEWANLLDRELFKLDPFLGDPDARTVLMSKEIRDLLIGDKGQGPLNERCGRLLASLQRVVRGELLKVCMTPRKHRQAQMGRLDPIEHSIFDIRCRDKPALRAFCRFAEKDVLVAFTCAPRSVSVPWLPRPPLGPWRSKQWSDAITECRLEWNKLFPAHDPVRGDCLNAYLSNAVPE